MIGISEIYRRIEAGPTMSAETFGLDVVFTNATRLCEKYKIVYDPACPVPSDDDLADRVFQAGIDLVVETVIYCLSRSSVIQFTRDEVLQAVANSRGRCIMGEGKDRYEWTPRLPDSDIKPWYHVGTGIVNTDERIVFNLAKSYAQIKQANSVSVPALEKIDSIPISSGTPTEILGAIRGIKIVRDALRYAGRPGLVIGILIFDCGYHLTFPIHITRLCSTIREVLWCAALSAQAISRNTKECVWSLGYMAAGPMTKQFFYETAAYLAAVIPSGVSAQTTHPARAVLNDDITPMEMKGSVEINEVCVGMSCSQGNELAKELLSKYEDKMDNAPIGKQYQDCYDIDSGLPSQEYIDLYGEVKEELRAMGFDFRLEPSAKKI